MTLREIKDVIRIVHFRRYDKLPSKTEYAEARVLSIQGGGGQYTVCVRFPTWEGQWRVRTEDGFVVRID